MASVTYGKCIMANVNKENVIKAKVFMAKVLWQMKLSQSIMIIDLRTSSLIPSYLIPVIFCTLTFIWYKLVFIFLMHTSVLLYNTPFILKLIVFMNTLFNLIFIVLSLTGLGLSIYTFYVETKVCLV